MKDSNAIEGLQKAIDAAPANRRVLAVIAVVLLAGLAGCVGGGAEDVERPEEDVEYESVEVHTDTTRFIDREAGVVCYKYGSPSYDEAGISCLPIDQTDLEGSDL